MCSAEATQARAAAEDPGRTAVYALVLLTSGSSLLATTALVHRARLLPGSEGGALVGLSLANVALCWALTHTTFTLRYAHLYYRRDEEGVGGVEFPGGAQPSYFDFAYRSAPRPRGAQPFRARSSAPPRCPGPPRCG